jgi:Zn-finger nucleic acid-binding protein
MELFERRHYFYCSHCRSFHFLDAPEVEGLKVLAASPEARACPRCAAPLARAIFDSAESVDYCRQCRGVLLTRGGFVELIRRRRAWASGAPIDPPRLSQTELEQHARCPACHQLMDVHPYLGPGNVVIDTCATCDVVWLDFGELKQIEDAPGRDRGKGDPYPEREPAMSHDEENTSTESSVVESPAGVSLALLFGLFD